jgi:hypothetical protein
MASWFNIIPRELQDFPPSRNGKENETTFGDYSDFNLTTLREFNYSYYSNQTVSNGSKCYLTFEPYVGPTWLAENGTWFNATKCYSAINPIGTRGNTGIGLAVAYGIALILILTTLAKHGRLYLPTDRRFFPIGRRWQWYWGCFICGCALISLLINIDVDRYYLQELPLIVTVFFWFLMCNGTLGLVWEAVRHWGSWQERQFVDPNPFVYQQNDRRSMIEFWMPLWFYFWNWLNFFLVVPRSWNFLKAQSTPEQVTNIAIPAATSPRFKAAAFTLIIAWATIIFSLMHSIKWYKQPRSGFFLKPFDYLRNVPIRLLLLIILSLGTIAYQVFMSFMWEYSIMRYDGVIPVQYGWGYGPTLVILVIQIAYGFISPNEDRELLRQRRERGEILDRELGLVRKPAWWARVRGDHLLSFRDKLLRNVKEVGTERGIGRRQETDAEREARLEAWAQARNDGFELSPLNGRDRDANNPRADRAGARRMPHHIDDDSTFGPPSYATDKSSIKAGAQPGTPAQSPPTESSDQAARAFTDRVRWLQGEDGPAPPPYRDQARRRESSSTNGSTSNAQPQQVRSMLDI